MFLLQKAGRRRGEGLQRMEEINQFCTLAKVMNG